MTIDSAAKDKTADATTGVQRAPLDGYVDRPTLAKHLRVTPRTISEWIARPDGLPHVKLGRSYFFHVQDVRTWIERRVRQRNPIPRPRLPRRKAG